MTVLCVDIGNSAIKVGRVSGGRVDRVTAVPGRAAAAEVARVVARVVGGRRIDRAAVSSVRPASTAKVLRAIERELGVAALVVTHRVALPIEIAVRFPARLGADRICAACGAVRGGLRDAIVVDAGTAVTVDLVLDRRFLGGVILPGPQVMLTALHACTAQLPELRVARREPRGIDDTRSAMTRGATLAVAGGIRAAVELLEERAGSRPARWLAGGHGEHLQGRLPGRWHRVPHLTLIGLAEIARLNPA